MDWWQFAPQLQRDHWLDREDARRLALHGWFGALIANTDMPLGNAGLLLADSFPLALAPAYDMLPMAFRPTGTGEVVERPHSLPLPLPQQREIRHAAAAMAVDCWQRVVQAATVSTALQRIADDMGRQLRQARHRLG